MFNANQIDYGALAMAAKEKSPLLLQALGRIYGIGPSERAAFGQNDDGIPTWSWCVLALAAGVVIGTRVQKAYPHRVPKLISG